VPILGKYLVIIANPVDHPMHAQPSAPTLFPRLSTSTNPTIMPVLPDMTGGHFSA
jgi:hypothetical protein